jgi:hypothetical protein
MPVITDAEVATFESFFLQMGGRYGIFTLTYNGVNYTNCRFDTDNFVVDYTGGPNVNSITLPWIAVPA